MFTTMSGKRLTSYAAVACVLVLIVVGGLWWAFRDAGYKQITAYFPEAVGVYPGSDLRVLGVSVGTIETVRPQAKHVKVTMSLDPDVAVPADAKAVVVAPSVVAGRYVQLTPAYSGGKQITSGTVIPSTRTATPVEVDQLYTSLRDLTDALGPNGANANGALSDLLDTGSANLDGNGKSLGTMISSLGKATRTLSGAKKDLFGTVDHLQQFTTMLKNNDASVRKAEQQLADVAGFLADDRKNLGGALDQLSTALGTVQHFIDANRGRIKTNVSKLASITRLMTDNRASIAEAMDDIPLALTNVLNAYDPNNGTLDGRGDLNEISAAYLGKDVTGGAAAAGDVSGGDSTGSPAVCSVAGDSCSDGGTGELRPVPDGARAGLPALPLPPAGTVYGSQGGGQ